MNFINLKTLLEADTFERKIVRDAFDNVTKPIHSDMKKAAESFDPGVIGKAVGGVATDVLKKSIGSGLAGSGIRISDGNTGADQVKSACMDQVSIINANMNDTAIVARSLSMIGDAVAAGFSKSTDKPGYTRLFQDKYVNDISGAVKSRWLTTEDDNIRDVVKIIIGGAANGSTRDRIKSTVNVDSPKYAALLWNAAPTGAVHDNVVVKLINELTDVDDDFVGGSTLMYNLFKANVTKQFSPTDIDYIKKALAKYPAYLPIVQYLTPTASFSEYCRSVGSMGDRMEHFGLWLNHKIPQAYKELGKRSGIRFAGNGKYIMHDGGIVNFGQDSAGKSLTGAPPSTSTPAQAPAPVAAASPAEGGDTATADLARFRNASGIDFTKLSWFVDHNWLNPNLTRRCYDMLVAAYNDPAFAAIPSTMAYRNRWNMKWYFVGQIWSIAKKLGLPDVAKWQQEHDKLKVNPA